MKLFIVQLLVGRHLASALKHDLAQFLIRGTLDCGPDIVKLEAPPDGIFAAAIESMAGRTLRDVQISTACLAESAAV